MQTSKRFVSCSFVKICEIRPSDLLYNFSIMLVLDNTLGPRVQIDRFDMQASAYIHMHIRQCLGNSSFNFCFPSSGRPKIYPLSRKKKHLEKKETLAAFWDTLLITQPPQTGNKNKNWNGLIFTFDFLFHSNGHLDDEAGIVKSMQIFSNSYFARCPAFVKGFDETVLTGVTQLTVFLNRVLGKWLNLKCILSMLFLCFLDYSLGVAGFSTLITIYHFA